MQKRYELFWNEGSETWFWQADDGERLELDGMDDFESIAEATMLAHEAGFPITAAVA